MIQQLAVFVLCLTITSFPVAALLGVTTGMGMLLVLLFCVLISGAISKWALTRFPDL